MHDTTPGDGDFASFVHATGTTLYRTALLLCGDHHLAEDLTQTTYAKVFAKWGRVRRCDSPTAYTRTVLLNTFLSHRRLRRSSERPVDCVPEGAADDVADPTVRLDLLAALAGLAPADRAVLVLRFWEDRSVEDTAALMGVSPGAVRTRSSRALARLRERLGDDPGLQLTTTPPASTWETR
jgi:RNA polymerase sigma-70 factor (sigma-E family)